MLGGLVKILLFKQIYTNGKTTYRKNSYRGMKKAKEILKKLKLRPTLQRVAITEILLRKRSSCYGILFGKIDG